jgi:diguanylate cyclase (GGDEF)-like protein
MTKNIAFDEIIKNSDRLPTLPGIALKLIEAVRKEDFKLDEITQIISSDPPLSAEILKCVNSPSYSLKTQVTSVNHAVNMLGLNTVKNLALSFSLIKGLQPEGPFSFDYESFWKDSLTGAVSAKLLAASVKPDLSEDAFFLGLLHNIGILALVRCLPKQYTLVSKEMVTSNCTHHEAEDLVFGFNHMAVGKSLMESWGLPEIFSLPIGCHHQPEELSTKSAEIEMLTKILHLSTCFVDLFKHSDTGINLGLIELYAKNYKFDDQLNIDEIGEKIQQHNRQIFPLFEISINDEKDYADLIESARKEIINLSNDLMTKVVAQKKEIERLRKLIVRDSMTPLINYQHFHELLNQEIYRSRRYKFPLSIAIADIDDFETINDKFSHPAGDFVIKQVADCLKKQLRQSDSVARYGGNAFGIIMPETPIEGGLQAAQRLRKEICAMDVVFKNNTIPFTMSFGVAALLPEQEVAKDGFIKMADDALILAKKSGKNQCFATKAENDATK